MSSVWLTIPSARPPAEVAAIVSRWKRQGYKVALWRDSPHIDDAAFLADTALLMHGPYPGYAQAVNKLVAEVMGSYPDAEWFIAAGDDTEPDMNHTAEEIAVGCIGHFTRLHYGNESHRAAEIGPLSTFGVMQPTGDRFAGGSIDRIAGSAWYGREYCARVNGGNGPLWPEYTHMFVDEEAQCVAQKLGVFWQRPDLIHLHHHFQRANDDLNSPAVARQVPTHLVEANSQEHWNKYQAIFNARKAAGFPGHKPLPVAELTAR